MMTIKEANINDLILYNDIYKEYVLTQLSFIDNNSEDLKKHIENFDFMERNRNYISSNYAKSYLLFIDNTIIGFMEMNYSKGDNLFEQPHIYVSNLYIKPKYRKKVDLLKIISGLMNKITEYAKENNVNYICNDYLADNKITANLNKVFGFKEYKIRGVKKI